MGGSIIDNPYDDYTIFIGKRQAGKNQLYTCANVCVFPSAVAIPNDDSFHMNSACLTSYTACATLYVFPFYLKNENGVRPRVEKNVPRYCHLGGRAGG
jgi:hypothetical protein